MIGEVSGKMNVKSRALIVAPDREESRLIQDYLDLDGGFEVSTVTYEAATSSKLDRLQPRLILLAILEDDHRGLLTFERLRHRYELPLVICSRNGSDQDIIRGLGRGADEYLVIPMDPREFAARVRAVLRRSVDWPGTTSEQTILSAGELEIHLDEELVFRRGKVVDLSPTEFRLLTSLVRRAGQLVTHSHLLAEVWGPQYVDARHYLRLYMRYLRAKIEDNPRAPKSLINEWGIGYRFEPSGASVTLPADIHRSAA